MYVHRLIDTQQVNQSMYIAVVETARQQLRSLSVYSVTLLMLAQVIVLYTASLIVLSLTD